MKQIHANYTFQASTKTITLFGLRIAQNQLLLITNATRGVIYYNFASPTNRAVVTESQNVNNTTIILTDVSTAGHSDSDKLTIYYDDQLSAQTGSLKYLTEVIATANDLGNSQITTLAHFNLADDPENLVGAIVVIPYIPFGSLSGLVRLKISGGWSVLSTISAKLADGTTPAFLLKEQFAPLFLPPRTTRIIIEKVNEQGNVSAEGILSTQDIAFKVYRAPEVDYDNPPYSVNIAIETKNAVGNKAESAASSDTGTFSLISLFKRLLSRVTSLVPANLTVTSSRLLVDGSGVTQPISASSLPLPSGAATSANQTTANTSLANIDTDLGAQADASATTDTGTFSLISLFKRLLGKIPSLTAGNRVPVDGSGVTQPVSGSVSVTPTSGSFITAINLNANMLPSDMHIARSVGDLNEGTASTDSSGSLIALFKRLLSRITSLVPANLTVTSSRLLVDGSGVTQPVSLANTGANSIPIKVDGSSVTQPVSNATLGSTSDANAGGFAGNFSVISLLKYLANLFVIKLDQRNPFQGVPVLSAYTIGSTNTNELAFTITGRKYYVELKNASSNVMYVNFQTTATSSGYRLQANERLVFNENFAPSGQINVFGTAGDRLQLLIG